MFFRLRFFGFLCAIGLFTTCSDDGDGVLAPDLTPQEQLASMMEGIQFVGTLPNGMRINFSQAKSNSTAFTSPENGPNFTSAGNGISLQGSDFSSGTALLDVGDDSYQFQFVLCTTYGELSERYPSEFWKDPQLENWQIFIALGNSGYTEEEAVSYSPFFTVDNYLFFYIPNSPNRAFGSFSSTQGLRLMLQGRYELEKEAVLGVGNAFRDSGLFYEEYQLSISCN
ncbi:MAG: hypothetical protein AAF843_18190 [Bacteroidota bacterium]